VEEELEWEPSVTSTNIGVIVKDGIVTLTGYAPSYAEKRAAERAALRVSGVIGVAEEIEVRLPGTSTRTDAEIAKAVSDVVKWNVYLPDDGLKMKVENGFVTLEGEVQWQFQRENAERAIRNLTGVRGIANLLKVKPRVQPGEIKAKIRRALERTADEDAGHITVTTTGTEVTLGGKVKTWVEQQDAVRAAWAAPGVTAVHNHITIQAPMSVYA
jgi:osmotically-inducible protein OsmY